MQAGDLGLAPGPVPVLVPEQVQELVPGLAQELEPELVRELGSAEASLNHLVLALGLTWLRCT